MRFKNYLGEGRRDELTPISKKADRVWWEDESGMHQGMVKNMENGDHESTIATVFDEEGMYHTITFPGAVMEDPDPNPNAAWRNYNEVPSITSNPNAAWSNFTSTSRNIILNPNENWRNRVTDPAQEPEDVQI